MAFHFDLAFAPCLKNLYEIFQANDARKKVGSTKGMQTSVQTSQLLKYRAEQIVPKRIEEMVKVPEFVTT